MLQGIPVQGSNAVTAGTGSAVILAAATGKTYWIKSLLVSIEAFAATAVLSVGDGTITLFSMLMKDGNGSLFSIVFPGDGYQMTKSAGLSLTIGTASATARVSATGIERTPPS